MAQPHDPLNDNEISHLTMLLQTPEFIEILKKDTDFMQSLEKEQFSKKQNFVLTSDDKSSGKSEEDSFYNRLVLTNLGRSIIFYLFSYTLNFLHLTFILCLLF